MTEIVTTPLVPLGQTPPGTDTPGQTPITPNGQTPNGTPQDKTPIDSLPPDIQEYIKRLRDEAEEANKKAKADAKAKQNAIDAQLKEQGEFKQLAEQHEVRIKELEPIADRYSKLSEIVAKQIVTQTKEWPAELKSFDPGPDAPIEQRLEWLEKFGPLLEKLQLQAKGNSPGNGPNPKPSPGTAATIEQSYLDRLSAKYPKI